jgi:hypothetical protein
MNARQRLSRLGVNEPAAQKAHAAAQLFWLFADPLALILLVASGISASIGEVANAVIIAVMVLLGIALDFVQTFRSQRAMERLRASVATTATVLRDGQWTEVPRREVVPGDVLRLGAGDLVPADALLAQVYTPCPKRSARPTSFPMFLRSCVYSDVSPVSPSPWSPSTAAGFATACTFSTWRATLSSTRLC